MTEKQKRFADEYIIRKQIWAAKELAGRYLNIKNKITESLISECLAVIGSLTATSNQKYAAKVILDIKFGSEKANLMIEPFAVVSNRNDYLVSRWRKAVKERDRVCQLCQSVEKLEVHHISHWAHDPVNRINPENGVLLCFECHSNQHPELSAKMFGGAKHE